MVLFVSQEDDVVRPPDENDIPFEDKFVVHLIDKLLWLPTKSNGLSRIIFPSQWHWIPIFHALSRAVDETRVQCFVSLMRILFEDQQLIPLACASNLTKFVYFTGTDNTQVTHEAIPSSNKSTELASLHCHFIYELGYLPLGCFCHELLESFLQFGNYVYHSSFVFLPCWTLYVSAFRSIGENWFDITSAHVLVPRVLQLTHSLWSIIRSRYIPGLILLWDPSVSTFACSLFLTFSVSFAELPIVSIHSLIQARKDRIIERSSNQKTGWSLFWLDCCCCSSSAVFRCH